VFLINGFTRAAFRNLGKTPRDNNALTVFVIGLIRTSRQSFTGHVGIASIAQKALVKGSNVAIMDMQDSSINVIRC